MDPGELAGIDGQRVVDFDEEPVLPESSYDDTDRGWGEARRDNLDRLSEDRPPHWE